MARHKYRRSVNHIRKTVKANKVRDEISVVLVRVGNLDVAEHVADDHHTRIRELERKVTAGVRVMLMQEYFPSLPGNAVPTRQSGGSGIGSAWHLARFTRRMWH